MVEVILEERGSEEGQKRELDRALREFRREVIKVGIFDEMRKRVCYRSPAEMKKYKRAVENKKRARRRARREAKANETE